MINFTNTAARRLLKLELKISLCSGFIVKAVLVQNFWNFVWMIPMLLWIVIKFSRQKENY